MSFSKNEFDEMVSLRDKCNAFIKNVIKPIKTLHSDNIEKYLDRFIKFPALTSVVSVIFTSSHLVKNPSFALMGMLLVVVALLIALNIFRQQINNNKSFIEKMSDVEKPMLEFSKNLTVFSREQSNPEKEKKLRETYQKLENSYMENPLGEDEENDKKEKINAQLVYLNINRSYFLLLLGITLSAISMISFY